MPPQTLTNRQLNRALLARQLLLERVSLEPPEAVNQLAGLQAQIPRPPFIALWSRLENFRREDLATLIHSKQVVRATWLRATIHLVSTADYLRYRTTLQPLLTRAVKSIAGKRLNGMNPDEVIGAARDILGDGNLSFNELRPLLAERFPDLEERALGYFVRTHLPLVQVPTNDQWAWPAKAGFAVADRWLGEAVDPGEFLPELVKRYLAAFGPATPGDMQNWATMTGLRSVFDDMQSELVTYKDERGRTLYDLPDAPLPPEDLKVPVRFLADFDNAILGHDDRSRIVSDEHRKRLVTRNLIVMATFLVNGYVAGTWKIQRKRKVATLSLTPFIKLNKTTMKQLEREGRKLVQFVEPEANDVAIEYLD